ncbi:MAG: hypothetical protein K2G08_00365, partial [Paramuribaculum sp.]|nr:hypothetical protein [Paramuribaculum sp.]
HIFIIESFSVKRSAIQKSFKKISAPGLASRLQRNQATQRQTTNSPGWGWVKTKVCELFGY